MSATIHQFRDAGAPVPPVIENGVEFYRLMVEAAGGPDNIDSHESDLYVPVNDATRALVRRWRYRCNVTAFRSEIDGRLMFDCPFCFVPWWEARQHATNKRERDEARRMIEESEANR